MKKKAYRIELFDHEQAILYYPKNLQFPELNSVTFGSYRMEATILPHKTKKQTIAISKSLANQLNVPSIPLKLHLVEHEKNLFIGPIIGIFTAGFTKFPQVPIGNRSYNFSKYFKDYEAIGVLPIVFGIQHIEWEKGTVNGFFYFDSKWQQLTIPLPNVIYDRLPNRKIENLKQMKQLKEKIEKEYKIPWFNPGFFDKLDVYQKLSQSIDVKPLLPDTFPLESKKQFLELIENHHYLYVKPRNGSLGKGIYQIKVIKGRFFVRFRELEKTRLLKFPSVQSLWKYLLSKITISDYIIQRGIPLWKLGESVADFRIHTNKDKHGKWRVSAIAGKVAGLGSATTHLIAGGEVKSLDEIFPVEQERKEQLQKLKTAAILLSEHLEKKMDGILCEIGFDLGMDENGKLWMFEANSKPGRSIFSHPKLKNIEQLSRNYVLEYGIYLANDVIIRPEKYFHDFVLQ
ncbi:YheC/YheD family protein [Bacillus kwashiorkori]|uniref:YheC/YheD family endospore coat-associated protein n=1 Tax=Bacillus kwashiorkori TaxID=1522318 RepID=UPI000782EBA1|nr:YheC/YheD family protein [Bacillus kwashiorkori]